MKDYSRAAIYTIKCKNNPSLIYVGSTIQSLYKRFKGHKSSKRKTLLYTTINNDWDNWYIELYEIYPCKNRNELLVRECEVIKLISTLNMIKQYHKFYKNDNEKCKDMRRIWKEQLKKEKEEELKKKKEEIQKRKEATKLKQKEYNKQYYKQKKELKLKNI
jgi:hypothetical protein